MNLVVEYVPRAMVVPNSWNPNQQDDFIYEKELASIRAFGFIDPVLTRTSGDGYEIVDGEHRWRAAGDLGIDPIPIIDLGDIGDTEARQLTIVLNETRGRPEPNKLRDLLADLSGRSSVAELLDILPYTREQFDAFLKPFDWDSVEQRKQVVDDHDKWVLRTYRLPRDVAELLDRAIQRVQHDDHIPDWRALEYIVASYLAE